MSIHEAKEHFAVHRDIVRGLQTLEERGRASRPGRAAEAPGQAAAAQ